MLAVLEGLPGAGKSTALDFLGQSLDANVIEEIIGVEPVHADELFFVQNDIRKYDRIIYDRVNLMDRNFISTLCCNECFDRENGTTQYPRVSALLHEAQTNGLLWQPDAYIFLDCSVATSRLRQKRSNAPIWADTSFLRRARDFYHEYFEQSEVTVITIDTEKLAVAGVATAIASAVAALHQRLKLEGSTKS